MISGKEALIALANGEEVEYQALDKNFYPLQDFLDSAKLRLKPRTITINGIEVPAPFEPKKGEAYWCFSTQTVIGYGHNVYESEYADRRFMNMGVWRTEEEIKQVVEALRSIFK